MPQNFLRFLGSKSFFVAARILAEGLQTENERTQLAGFGRSQASKAVWAERKAQSTAEKGLTNGGGSGMMKMTTNATISSINNPIEQRHTGKGNPNAILMFDVELNNRQTKILAKLPDYDSKTIVPKSSVKMSDLSALTAKTGDEFAMFTKGNQRLIVRGNSVSVNIDKAKATQLSNQGYKWSGHTHPGVDFNVIIPSSGDKAILRCFKQTQSVIYDSKGEYNTFRKE